MNIPTKYGWFFDIFQLYMADILSQYICWNHWKNDKLKTVGVVFLPAPFDHPSMSFQRFILLIDTKCPHVTPKCEQLSYQYIWPTLVTYHKSCEWCEVKKQTFQQEPRGWFSVQLLWTENRHVPDSLHGDWPGLLRQVPQECTAWQNIRGIPCRLLIISLYCVKYWRSAYWMVTLS